MYFSTYVLNPGSSLDFRKVNKNQSPRDCHGKQSRQKQEIIFLCSSAFRLQLPMGTLQTLPNLFLFLCILLQAVMRISTNGRKVMFFSGFAECSYFVTDDVPLHVKEKYIISFNFQNFLELPLSIYAKKKLQSATGKS